MATWVNASSVRLVISRWRLTYRHPRVFNEATNSKRVPSDISSLCFRGKSWTNFGYQDGQLLPPTAQPAHRPLGAGVRRLGAARQGGFGRPRRERGEDLRGPDLLRRRRHPGQDRALAQHLLRAVRPKGAPGEGLPGPVHHARCRAAVAAGGRWSSAHGGHRGRPHGRRGKAVRREDVAPGVPGHREGAPQPQGPLRPVRRKRGLQPQLRGPLREKRRLLRPWPKYCKRNCYNGVCVRKAIFVDGRCTYYT